MSLTARKCGPGHNRAADNVQQTETTGCKCRRLAATELSRLHSQNIGDRDLDILAGNEIGRNCRDPELICPAI